MKVKFFILAFLFALSFLFGLGYKSVEADYTNCQGYGDPTFCTTGTKWTGPVSVCSYLCRGDGYTCTPGCAAPYVSSCTPSDTQLCTQVVVGCPRCGNSTAQCYLPELITPPPPSCGQACPTGQCGSGMTCRTFSGGSICAMNEYVDNNYCDSNNNEAACCHAPPPTPTAITPTPTPPNCQPGACDTAHSCRIYTVPEGEAFCKDGQGNNQFNGECVPDASCAPPPVGDQCTPTGRTCASSCANGYVNLACPNSGNLCCNAPPAATSVPPANTPAATVTPRATPTEGACFVGKACTCSGSGAGSCTQCNGGWCNGGTCETCSQCVGSGCGGGPPSCSRGEGCGAPKAGITPIIANNESCYPVSYPPGVIGQCCQQSGSRNNPWNISSCSVPVTPTVAPPTPTPSYIEVTGIATPTPRPAGGVGKPAQSWKCLKSGPYDGGIIRADGTNLDHQLTLSGSNFPNNKNIYIVGCALLGGNFQCTTGVASLDALLQIRKAPEHEFAVAGGPIVTTTDNSIAAIIVRSHTATSTIHTFFGVYSAGPDGSQNNQSGNTLQLGTFDAQSKNVSYTCIGQRWDPYGRVFDNDSLEPIPGINLELLSETKKLVTLPGLINPTFTSKGGEFNFLAEPGTYYLNPINLKNYSLVSGNFVNPDAKKAYLNIYSSGEKIVEKAGQPEHRDIALDPGKNPPFESKPESIEFTALPVPGTTQTRLVGQVTHPLTIVSFLQNEKELTRTVADNFGYYEVLVENSQIQPGIKIVPAFKKVLLTTIKPQTDQSFFQKIATFVQSFFKRTSAAPEPAQGAAIDLIPHYIEGYVYTSLGQKIDSAKVEVILKMSNESIYEIQTDSSGLITVPTGYVPIFPFYLRVTPLGSTTSFAVTTTQFMEQNQSYLNTNNINLMTGDKGK